MMIYRQLSAGNYWSRILKGYIVYKLTITDPVYIHPKLYTLVYVAGRSAACP